MGNSNQSLVDLILACSLADNRGITFISGENEERYVSYKQVYLKALGVLHNLQMKEIPVGAEVVIQIEDNEKFIYTFWACILGGIIPVPITVGKNSEHRTKLLKIWKILSNPYLVTEDKAMTMLDKFMNENSLDEVAVEVQSKMLLVEDILKTDTHGTIQFPKKDDIAFIQFSSGSTGDPKGVVLTHENLLSNAAAIVDGSDTGPEDSYLSWMPLTHDMGMIAFHLTPISININQYFIPTQLFIRRPVLWLKKVNDHKVTYTSSPNFGFNYFLTFFKPENAEGWDLSHVHTIYNGAEPISVDLCNTFLDKMSKYGLKRTTMYTTYGMAEASVGVAFPPCGKEFVTVIADRDSLSIGSRVIEVDEGHGNCIKFPEVGFAIKDCSVRICGQDNKELEDGIVGFIQIKGKNVTKGYYNNIEATKKVMTEDGWLISGDLGFKRKGSLVIIGRHKDIIFLNGQNYYPHDIERIAEGVEGIELGGIVACGVPNEELKTEDIVLFVLFKGSNKDFANKTIVLKKHINEQVGLDIKDIIPIKKIPKTTSGKVERYKLGERYRSGEFTDKSNELKVLVENLLNERVVLGPENEVQEKLLEIWKRVLGTDKISINDRFFEIGGQSITLMQVIDEINKQFDVELSFATFAEKATIAALGEYLSQNNENQKVIYTPFEEKQNIYAPFPLTEIQMAYLTGRDRQFELGGVSTHFYMEIHTDLNMKLFEKCIQKVIARHPMLRAIVHTNGEQQILEKVQEYKIEITDISELDSEEQQLQIQKEEQRMSHHVFKTDEWPLFEFKAFKLSENKSSLLVGFDMLIADGFSIQLIGRELMEIYNNSEVVLPPIDFTFRDYILSYKEFKNTATYKRDKEYWTNKVEDFPTAPALPLKCNPADVDASRFSRNRKVINKNDWTILKKIAQRHAITPSVLLCTAYAKVLAFWSNQPAMAINMTAFNRYPFHEDVNKIVGDFTSVIPLAIKLEGEMETFWKEAEKIQNTLFEALQHRHYDGVEFMRDISKHYNLGLKSLLPIVFTSMLFEEEQDGWSEIGEMVNGISQTSQVYLDNQVMDSAGSLCITWDWVSQIFDDSVINSMFDHYTGILEDILKTETDGKNIGEAFATDTSNKYVLSVNDKDREAITLYNSTEEDIVPETLQSLFAKTVKHVPENKAIIFDSQSMTYKELDEKSNQVANYLKAQGIKRNDLVGVLAKRCINTIVNVMGILKAGAAYVPIEPEYPLDRRTYILENSKCGILLDQHLPDSIKDFSSEAVKDINNLDDLAYIIYTSGSTGRPKGVTITHGAVSNTILDINKKYGINEKDRILGISSMCFDLSVYDVFGALSTGAALVIVTDQRDVRNLIDAVKKQSISVWNSVPAIMDMLVENVESDYLNNTLRVVMLSGDWIPISLPDRIKKVFPKAMQISLGGATEASIWSIYHPINEVRQGWKSIPYGRPLANQTFYVLNYEKEPCPIGVPGELYIGGIGLAKGYMNDIEKTQQAFINHPVLGDLYKTGDYGVLHQEGYIEFLGRKDQQIKIRGYRIELGEIEACLSELSSIKNMVVIDRTGANGKKYICAYMVTENEISPNECKEFLAEKLPSYMIPSYFVRLEKIPLSPNGKVDRKQLPDPEVLLNEEIKYVKPRNDTEYKLAEIWSELLQIEKVSVTEDFFDLGGDSLRAQRLANKINTIFDIKIPIRILFTEPTIVKLAEYIAANKPKPVKSNEPEIGSDNQFGQNDNAKLFWSSSVFWEQTCNGIRVGRIEYTNIPCGIFPKFYFLTQKGITLGELIENFTEIDADALKGIVNDFIKNRVLVSSLLTPQEVFEPQNALFNNEYGEEVIFDNEVASSFKKEQLSRTCNFIAGNEIVLGDWTFPEYISKRKTHRVFNENEKVSLQTLSSLLSVLKQTRENEDIRYYYASAGGLYPIDVYVYVKKDRVQSLAEGIYYYSPVRNSLNLVNDSCSISEDAHYFTNKSIFKSSAFSIFLMYNANANMPKYGHMGYFYACIDTGVMVQALTQAAEHNNIGLCSIGDMVFSNIKEYFCLGEGQVLLHTIEAGLKVKQDDVLVAAGIEAADMDYKNSLAETYPLSSAQKRLFVMQKMEEGNLSYNNPTAFKIHGELDRNKLEESFKEIILRHESLRSNFCFGENGPVQIIHENVLFSLEYFEAEESKIDEIRKGFVRPFDLSSDTLIRAAIIKLDNVCNILLLDGHHIIMDKTSSIIFMRELSQLYSGKKDLPMPKRYLDYIKWQSEYLKSHEIKKQEELWLKKFSGELSVLNLPTDYTRPPVQNFEGDRYKFNFDRSMVNGLKDIAASNGATLYMALLAAFKVLLYKYSGQEDITVGSPVLGRQNESYENVIGMFVNTLAIRNYPKSNITFAEFLKSVRGTTLEVFDNQDYQFEELVEKLDVRRDTSRNPLFDIMFVFQNMDNPEIHMDKLRLEPYELENKISKFDMSLEAEEKDGLIRFTLEYCTKQFQENTIRRMAEHFSNIVIKIIENPQLLLSEIDILSSEERVKVVEKFNNTKVTYQNLSTINQLFEEQVERTPNKTAVVFHEKKLTYLELNNRANCLARLLRKKGAKDGAFSAGNIVGILLNRSEEMLVAMMGILKAGGAYLPIDPEYPEERIKYMLKDSGAKILITQKKLLDKVSFDGISIVTDEEHLDISGATNLDNIATPESPAYVIYTSGSTGKPKGVMIPHAAVNNFIKGITEKIDFLAEKTILSVTTISFDIFVLETLLPLQKGLKIVIADEEQQRDPVLLNDVILKNQVEMIQTTPSRMQILLSNKKSTVCFKQLKEIMVGGEQFPLALLEELKKVSDARIYNMYGPTETTVWSTLSELTYCKKIHIGKPIANTQIYILDKYSNPQPVGVAGELCIGGDGLAIGYLNRQELTDEKFTVSPFNPHKKIYHTGDLARWLPDGNIECLGRLDHQVKIRGFRIELGEVESKLLNYNQINEAVVVAIDANGSNSFLCAYYVADIELEASDIRQFMLRDLPDYMVPSYFIRLDRIPQTPNGKVDRKALPQPNQGAEINQCYEAPSNETEERLLQIWKKVLGKETIGINDNFFDIGGNSMLLVQTHNILDELYPGKVRVADMFSFPSISKLTKFIDGADAADSSTRTEDIENKPNNGEIAVIGMYAKLPGSNGIEDFWQKIKMGTDFIGNVPEVRKKDVEDYIEFVNSRGGEFKFKGFGTGAFLDQIDKFDYKFFKLTPKEASLMDPNQRLFLEVAWGAIEDAGYGNDKLAGSRTGVYVGYGDTKINNYERMISDTEPADLPTSLAGNVASIVASRISYLLDLKGPSMIMDTACSSSLVAVHTACQAIKNGECELAIAGGVKTYLLPIDNGIKIGNESSDGRARTFDNSSDGTGGGEGVAAVLLKPLHKAIQDKDSIYAVIKGSATNQDGSSIGITAPNALAQEDVIIRAWKNAGIDPETISYIEAHGTGTKLGDPIEIEGITRAFKRYTDKKQFCAVGTVKTNIGHLDCAAGIVGLIKATMAIKHGELPPNLHFNIPNEKIYFEESPVYVNTALTKWETEHDIRRCGVSAFGLSGTNCHIILEEYKGEEAVSPLNTNVLTISAQSSEALQVLVSSYKELVENIDSQQITNVCYTANTGRGHYSHRLAIIFEDLQELKEKLSSFSSDESLVEGCYRGVHRIVNNNAEISQKGEITESNHMEISHEANSKIYDYTNTKTDRKLLELACTLYVQGAGVKWDELYKDVYIVKTKVPVYPFEQKRCWIEIPKMRQLSYAMEVEKILAGKELPDNLAAEFKTIWDKCRQFLDSNKKEEDTKLSARVSIKGRNDDQYSLYEIEIASAWQKALGFDELNIYDDFYELGGDSILAVKIANILNGNKIVVSSSDVLKYNTIADFAKYLEDKDSIEEEVYPEIERIVDNGSGCYPTSSAQNRLLILNEIGEADDTGYNMPGIMEVRGNLDVKRFENAFKVLIERHESLRTSFEMCNGEPVQRIHESVEFNIEMIEAEEERIKTILQEYIKPFDLTRAPLFRGKLIKVSEYRYVFMYDVHHIVSDGTSVGILIEDFMHIYKGEELPELKVQYKDYAAWQNVLLNSDIVRKQENYWLEKLAGELPTLDMRTDYPRPEIQSFEGDRVSFNIGSKLADEIYRLASDTGTTLYMVLLGAYNVLLSRHTGQEDIIVGSPVAGRPVKEVDKLIGLFANTLALRNFPEGCKTFKAFLSEIKDCSIRGFENEDYPFDLLINNLALERDISRNPLFDTMFVLQNMKIPDLKLDDLEFIPYDLEHKVAKFDIRFEVIPLNDDIKCTLEYCTKLYTQEAMEVLHSHYINILESIVKNPEIKLSDIELMSEDEKEKVKDQFNCLNNEQVEMFKSKGFIEEIEVSEAAVEHEDGDYVGVKAYVIDKWDRLQPIGVPGQLCLKGSSNTKIIATQGKSLEKIHISKDDGDPGVYKTGITARWLPDGRLELIDIQDDKNVDKHATQLETLVVAATFTAEPIEDYVKWWTQKFGISTEVKFAPYNQVFQELLDESSMISTNTSINMVLARFEDWIRDDTPVCDIQCSKLDNYFEQFIEVLKGKQKRAPYLVGIFPVSNVLGLSVQVAEKIEHLNNRMRSEINGIPNLYLIDFSEICELYNISEVFDPIKDKEGHMPFGDGYYAAIGTTIARFIYALKSRPFKVIAVDCDNTLWSGVCAEEGALGVTVDNPYIWLQQFLIKQYEEGMLLTLLSKNSDEDVWEVFDKNPMMLLKKEHFVDWKINWKPKSENIKEMAKNLNLGLDSFIFIDDSVVECSDMMSNSRQVLTLCLPEDSRQIPDFLKHVWAFDRLKVTDEDKKRSEMYIAEKLRQDAKLSEGTLENFLLRLDLKVSIRDMDETQIERIAQLTQRTNQFNMSTIRRSEEEIAYLMGQPGVKCCAVEVKDSFGDYGLVGALFTKIESDYLFVDTFLLSCRVLGRGVEDAILTWLRKTCMDSGLSAIQADFYATAKNMPFKEFMEKSGWEQQEVGEGKICFRITVDKLPVEIEHINCYFDTMYERQEPEEMKESVSYVLDHVAVAVYDIEKSKTYYSSQGYSCSETIHDELQNVYLVMCRKEGHDSIELVAAVNQESPCSKTLEINGEVPYHLCYKVISFEEFIDSIKVNGIDFEIVSEAKPAKLFDNKHVMFLSIDGVGLIELVQDSEGIKQSLHREENVKTRVTVVLSEIMHAVRFYMHLGYVQEKSTSEGTGKNLKVVMKKPGSGSIVLLVPATGTVEYEFLQKNGAQTYSISEVETSELHKTIQESDRTGWKVFSVDTEKLLHGNHLLPLMHSNVERLLQLQVYEAAANNRVSEEYVAPRTSTEEIITEIWQDILKIKKIGAKSNFFTLGGNSLKATALVSKIHKELNVVISLRDVFKNPTIEGLAKVVTGGDMKVYSSISCIEDREYYPLTSPQKRMFIVNQMNGSTTGYNMPAAFIVEGPIDLAKFEEIFSRVIERHEGLRTYFESLYGEPVQKIQKNVEFKIGYTVGNEDEIGQLLSAFVKPFDLSVAPLIRVELVKLTDEKHLFMFDMSHIISDAVSLGIVIRDFIALYNGKKLLSLRIQYKDYAVWRRNLSESEYIRKQESYWMDRFKDNIPVLNLPVDYQRPLVKSFEGYTEWFGIDSEMTKKIKELVQETNSTLFMVLLGVFNVMLAKCCLQEDIVVGSPIAGRPHADLENIIGVFINTIAMRNKPEGVKSFIEFLEEVKENALKAYENQDYQFEELIEKLQIPRDSSRNPIFDVMFIMQNAELPEMVVNDLKFRRFNFQHGNAKFDIMLEAFDEEDSITFSMECSTKLFSRSTIEKFRDYYLVVIKEIIDNPYIKISDIQLLTNEEKEMQLQGLNDDLEEEVY